ncbi:hypothetical protein AOLI_G00190520 [Acnodon oligacanthus]
MHDKEARRELRNMQAWDAAKEVPVIQDEQNSGRDPYGPSQSSKEKEKMTIYLCATMWHETYDEMMKMIVSMFRLDKFRPKKNQFGDVAFESHIYIDDAFKRKGDERRVNEYAETLAEVIREVYVLCTCTTCWVGD